MAYEAVINGQSYCGDVSHRKVLELGRAGKQVVLLTLTLLVVTITLGSGRATVGHGAFIWCCSRPSCS